MRTWGVAMLVMACGTAGFAQGCMAPAAPFMPAELADIRAYADLLREDFEIYFTDAQAYFRCLERERRAVFDEVQQLTQAYAQMIELLAQE
ncbi:hypothetical protein N5A93_06250 [Roseovarius sp. EGI FJ00037]|uniref:hypothetical protein n=1 Tax=Roseovarius salincola TaxID=2978479 RepID=UPI0022A84AD4|nr:hypothetical protein [Roseovarius sp. EGI FJ00037]MCZ0811828.1 hypothetical protein [Roseovarius sp. EGI FJ00037]